MEVGEVGVISSQCKSRQMGGEGRSESVKAQPLSASCALETPKPIHASDFAVGVNSIFPLIVKSGSAIVSDAVFSEPLTLASFEMTLCDVMEKWGSSGVDTQALYCPKTSGTPIVSEDGSLERFVSVSNTFGLESGVAFDLRTGVDLSTAEGQRAVWDHLQKYRPYLVVGSPPCASFSVLQNVSKPSESKAASLKRGLAHLYFSIEVCMWQNSQGRLFLHEHPSGAWSWQLRAVQELRSLEGVVCVSADQCMFGQWVQCDGAGNWGLAKRPTKFLTNSTCIAESLDRRCDGSHSHVRLAGGLARQAERYPPQLVAAILKGARD
eukprot:4657461-Amphidinium_carterae.1